jgi:hypothetical protein
VSERPSERPSERMRQLLGEQLRQFLALRAEHGPDRAREIALAGLPERQSARLGPLLQNPKLAHGLAQAAPALAEIGILTEFIDVSTADEDAAVEVMLTCTCLAAAAELGQQAAEPVICDLDVEATRRAFPDLRISTLARQTDERRICAFRLSRAAPASRRRKEDT